MTRIQKPAQAEAGRAVTVITENSPLRRLAGLRFVTLLIISGALLLAAGCSGQPELVVNAAAPNPGPARARINTPSPLPTGLRPTQGPILAATSSPAAAQRSAATATSPAAAPRSVQGAAPTNTPAAAFALAGPAFEIAPEIGVPGTSISVVGQNWPSRDVVSLRLQDPANLSTQGEYVIAQADESGAFHVNFMLPVTPPWSTLPALILTAVSQSTGVQAAQPEPFVFVNQPIAVAQPTAATATPTGEATAVFLPTPTVVAATATPVPTSGLFQSPAATPTRTPVVVPTAAASPSPTPTRPAVFNSPLPTPTATIAPPSTLPGTGNVALGTATVIASEVNLRSGPGLDYPVLAVFNQGTMLGVLGQDESGAWLLVTTGHGAPAWVFRASTNYAGRLPVSQP